MRQSTLGDTFAAVSLYPFRSVKADSQVLLGRITIGPTMIFHGGTTPTLLARPISKETAKV